MTDRRFRFVGISAALRLAALLLLIALVGCQPAPTPTPAPARLAEKPAEQPAASAAPAKPSEKPAAAPTTAPAPAPTAAAAPAKPPQGDRLVIALVQWGSEASFAWKISQGEKPLWDIVYDSLIMRDPKTFEFRPGLATEWKPSADYKSWTFKLRQGVMFHDNWGELTAEDVKFTVEQNLKPDATGGSAPFFRTQLDKIETPDKYTVVMTFKTPVWEVPTHFAQMTGYQNIVPKKYLEQVGEEKAALHPIGTGPYKFVEGKQGDFYRFEALPAHWRQTPAYKELIIRRMPEPAARLAAVRSGEVDIAPVTGDFLDQAKRAGLRIHEIPNVTLHWVVLPGQTTPDKPDYCPKCPWVGDPSDPKSLENARKVRLALNLAVNKKAIIDGLFRGYGAETPFSYWYFPFHKGYSTEWKIPPYDPQRAKQLLAEAGVPSGFEIKLSPTVQNADGPDIVEAVALDWEKLGIKVQRFQEEFLTFFTKVRARKTGVVGWEYAPPSGNDEPSLSWQRTVWSKGQFYMLAEGPYDKDIEAILVETDPDKRARLTHDFGQKLYEDYRGIMIGMKSGTWAVSKKVGNWPSLVYSLFENNFEYITP